METKTNTNQNPDKSRKVIRIVISILVAIALWVYVDRGLSVEVTMKVNNVPVEFSGEDTSLAEKNLMLLSGYDTTIDLVLKGPRSELFKLDKSKVRIVADTSTIQETGQQTLSYQVYFQDDIQRSKITPAPTASPLPWGRWTARPCPSAATSWAAPPRASPPGS